MLKNRYTSIATAGAAVLSAILTQRFSSWRSELPAELVCWLVLPVLFRVIGRGDPGRNRGEASLPGNHGPDERAPGWPAWGFAVSIALSSCFKNEAGMVKLYPALTPLLLVLEERLASRTRVPSASTLRSMSGAKTIWVAVLIAVFSCLNLLYWDHTNAVPAIIPAVALVPVYCALLPGTWKGSTSPLVRLEDDVAPVSVRTAFLLAVAFGTRTIIWGGFEVDAASAVLLGLFKASSWYTLVKTSQCSSWCLATTVGTFAIASTRSPFVQSSEIQAVAHVATSSLSLGQTIYLLPRQLKGRYTLWIFILIPLIPYIANVLAIRETESLVMSKDHPVELLSASAKAEFELLVNRQSKSYAAAHREYLHRYGIEPPPGFRAWYEFAESRESPIIDDFDIIHERIAPFWELSGSEVREVMDKVLHASGNEVWGCSTTNETCSHRHRTNDRNFSLLFNTLLQDLRSKLPAVDYLINHYDEPAVLIPPEALKEGKEREKVKVRNVRKKPLWPEITRYCRPPMTEEDAAPPETYGLSLVTSVSSSKELCRHTEYYETHGLLARPKSAKLIEGAVPVLSTGSFSTMGDLIFPSPAYIEDGFKYDPSQDVEWEEKRNNLYWAGSTTGGYALDNLWRLHQRQRFVELAQNLVSRPHVYLREVEGAVTRVTSSFLNSRLFDVAFTRVGQCEGKYCRDQEDYFEIKGWAPKDEALQSRLAFDIDGNGISGRYYKLLASKSTPLKMTIIKEWHDERLVPWVHYVPVSAGMEELPELVTYLTSTREGQERARDIAEGGRRWYFQALREDDMAIYVYRLLLELARIQDPEREAGHPRRAVL